MKTKLTIVLNINVIHYLVAYKTLYLIQVQF